jgi:hypothetical protein
MLDSLHNSLRRINRRRGRLTRDLAGVGVLFVVASSLPSFAQDHPTQFLTVYNGKLEDVTGTGLILQTGKKDLKLSARTTYLFHTLQDKRLANKAVRLAGIMKPDGTFEVDHFFTIHDGKLFRVRYYCEVCNIEALEPGRCVCCQQPTELQEIPVDQTK